MALTLYFHPLASFCQKALIGLYELEVPFSQRVIDLGADDQRAELARLWPLAKFPVLRDAARDLSLPESSVILEYVAERFAPASPLIPKDEDRARECRLRDRFYDLYVNTPMSKIVTDRLRPEGARDSHGVAEAKALLETAYGIADGWARESTWAAGEAFTLADCAAAPALLYAREVLPFAERHPSLAAYFERLRARASFARVMKEAEPYWSLFPG